MKEVSEHVGINYPEIPNSRCVAQQVDYFLFPWKGEESVENPIFIEEHEGFSEPRTPVSEPPRQQSAIEAKPVLRTQLLDSSLICK